MELEDFQYTKPFYLNMGCYHIWLIKNASNLSTIIIHWRKYRYKRLPMVVANSPDIFQHNMNDLFHGFEFICACIYDLLILTKSDWTDHVHNLELTLNKLKGKGFKCKNVILKIHSLVKPKKDIYDSGSHVMVSNP